MAGTEIASPSPTNTRLTPYIYREGLCGGRVEGSGSMPSARTENALHCFKCTVRSEFAGVVGRVAFRIHKLQYLHTRKFKAGVSGVE